jgi:hypothetical protein
MSWLEAMLLAISIFNAVAHMALAVYHMKEGGVHRVAAVAYFLIAISLSTALIGGGSVIA